MLGALESRGSHSQECGLGPEGGEGLTPHPEVLYRREMHSLSGCS